MKKANLEDWQKILFFEKKCSSDVFHAIDNEKEVKEYIKGSIVYFVILDSEEIGTVSYEVKKDNVAYIDGLTILPEYRGKGIGTFAIRKILKELENFDEINLVVHPRNNSAIVVYLKNGFEIKKWESDFFGKGEHRLFLVKNLK